MSRVLDIFSGITVRIGVIVAGLSAMIAAAIVVGLAVFDELSINMEDLANEQIPALQQGSEVISLTSHLKDGLTEILLASDETELEAALKNAALTEQESALLASFEKAGAQQLSLLVDVLQDNTKMLAEARADEFVAEAQIAASVAELRDLNAAITTDVSERSVKALFELGRGGSDTITSVESSLRGLMERDVMALEIAMQIRSELSLYSGAVLAIASTGDPAVSSMLGDIVTSADNALSDLIPALAETGLADEAAASVARTRAAIAGILRNGQRMGIDAGRVLEARQEGDLAMVDALDDIQFGLVMNAEKVSEKNRSAIRALLDVHVQRIRDMAALSDSVRDVFGKALLVALAETPSEALGLSGKPRHVGCRDAGGRRARERRGPRDARPGLRGGRARDRSHGRPQRRPERAAQRHDDLAAGGAEREGDRGRGAGLREHGPRRDQGREPGTGREWRRSLPPDDAHRRALGWHRPARPRHGVVHAGSPDAGGRPDDRAAGAGRPRTASISGPRAARLAAWPKRSASSGTA